jgi:hypothetical protein
VHEAGRVVDQDAHLDVSSLAAVGEVGGGHEGPGFVDDDAIGVETASGLRSAASCDAWELGGRTLTFIDLGLHFATWVTSTPATV